MNPTELPEKCVIEVAESLYIECEQASGESGYQWSIRSLSYDCDTVEELAMYFYKMGDEIANQSKSLTNCATMHFKSGGEV